MKKLISILLCLCTVVSLIPCAVAYDPDCAHILSQWEDGDGYSIRECIYCGFYETEDYTNPFTDVKNSDYFFSPVMWAVNKGVTNGTAPDKFSPNATCTRAHAVTFMWRAMGSPKAQNPVNPFSDVKEKAYYYDAVLWAVEAGIVNGMAPGKFVPDGNCTRGQIVTMLYRLAGEPQPIGAPDLFNDVKEGAYYYNAVTWAVAEGITNGAAVGKFLPDASCTRGQIVTFLYRDIVGAKINITAQPENAKADDGDEVTFTVSANGGAGALTYRWQFATAEKSSFQDIEEVHSFAKADENTLKVKFHITDIDLGFKYRCIITDANDNKTISKTVKVDAKSLAIARQPEHAFSSVGKNAEFSVLAVGGAGGYTYQWQYANKNTGESYTDIYERDEWAEGANTHTLTVKGLTDDDFDLDYRYRCVITDADGNKIISNNGRIYRSALTVKTQPKNVSAEVGDIITFTAEAEGGTAPLQYQWQLLSRHKDPENLLSLIWTTYDIGSDNVPTWCTGYKEKTLTFRVYSEEFTASYEYAYRCKITDAEGHTVYTDMVKVEEKK